MAHVVEIAAVVVEAEQQRAQRFPVLVPAPAQDHAVGGALVLDLGPQALAGHIRRVPGLGDDAVQARPLELVEPLGGHRRRARVGRQMDRRPGAREQRLQTHPPPVQRLFAQVFTLERDHVESHEPGGRALGQRADPRLGRVDALLKGVEVEAGGTGHDDLAVQDHLPDPKRTRRLDQLREVARHVTLAPADQRHSAFLEMDQCPEAVPFGLVLPLLSVGHLTGWQRRRQHRLHVERNRVTHRRDRIR